MGKISFFNLIQNFPRGIFLRNLGNFLLFVPRQTSCFPSTLPLWMRHQGGPYQSVTGAHTLFDGCGRDNFNSTFISSSL